MQEPMVTIVIFSMIGISQIAMSIQSKLRWIYALSLVGIALVVIGVALRGYYNEVLAFYLLSIPGVVLVGISAVLQVTLIVLQIRASGHLKGEA